MGQKTHPTGFRLGIIKTWSSRWYQDKNYAKWLHEDLRLQGFIKKKLAFGELDDHKLGVAEACAFDVAMLPEGRRPDRFDFAALEKALRERFPKMA